MTGSRAHCRCSMEFRSRWQSSRAELHRISIPGWRRTPSRLRWHRQLLSAIHNDHHREHATYERVANLLPEQAFAAGRDFERETRKSRHIRREFVEVWAKTKKKLGA